MSSKNTGITYIIGLGKLVGLKIISPLLQPRHFSGSQQVIIYEQIGNTV